LARMKIREEAKAVYSTLNFTDFEKAESSAADIFLVLKEFTDNISGYKIVAVLSEPSKSMTGFLIALHEQIPAEDFLQKLDLGGKVMNFEFGNYKVLECSGLNLPLETLEDRFLEALQKLGPVA